VGIPKPGINANDITFYLNNSDSPNLKIVNSTKCNMVIFKTMKDIKKEKNYSLIIQFIINVLPIYLGDDQEYHNYLHHHQPTYR
jgi:hypothetical protein